jgi:type II secretory pathway pseudopilin PulG
MNRKTEGRVQDGFTIIEVLMFVAISGALLALMVFAVYRMIDNSRFSDTINSATSFVQTQYEEARSGVRPSSEGICNGDGENDIGRSNCLLLGKAIVLRDIRNGEDHRSAMSYAPDRMESYFIISDEYDINASKTDIDGLGGSDASLAASKPRLVVEGHKDNPLMYSAHYAVSEDESSFPGAGLLYRDQGLGGSNDTITTSCETNIKCQINVILVLRNPKSAALNTYAFYVALNDTTITADSPDGVVYTINHEISKNTYAMFQNDEGSVARNASIAIPIVNGDSNSRSFGAICIEQGASSASIFGAREISYYSNINKNLGIVGAVNMLRDKCENM